jgi:uncharacterized protein
MSPTSNKGMTALVTGASSGIGFELSRLLARDGFRLVLVARDRNRLERAARELRDRFEVSVLVIPMDLSTRTAAEEIVRELQKEAIEINVLVNNAGYALYGPFIETDFENEIGMMQVNMESLTRLTKRLLPAMIKKKEGKIMNVASTAAFAPGPLMAVYYATKAYVLSFSEALSQELRGTGVTVTALCPGATETGFQERARTENTILFSPWKVMDAGTVARIGYHGMMKGKAVVIPGWLNKLMVFSIRMGPRSYIARFSRILQEKRKPKS